MIDCGGNRSGRQNGPDAWYSESGDAGGALGGAGLGAAAGGLIGALTDMGVPEDEAKHYEDQIREGKPLVTVRADNDTEADRASNMMDVQGAVDVEGGSSHDSPEATPEYEGTRSRVPVDATKERTRAGRADYSSERPFGGAPATVGGRRVRVYGRMSEKP